MEKNSRINSEDHRVYPSIPLAMQLAKPLGVTLDYLCGMYGMYEEEERVLARPYSIRRLLIYGGMGKAS